MTAPGCAVDSSVFSASPVFDPWEECDIRYVVSSDGKTRASDVSRRAADAVMAMRSAGGQSLPVRRVTRQSRGARPAHYDRRVPASPDLSVVIKVADDETLPWTVFDGQDSAKVLEMLAVLRCVSLLLPGGAIFPASAAHDDAERFTRFLASIADLPSECIPLLSFVKPSREFSYELVGSRIAHASAQDVLEARLLLEWRAAKISSTASEGPK